MGRTRTPTTSSEISVEIIRIQEESRTCLQQLEERRRVAHARENQQRGELIATYLAGPRGDALRSTLREFASPDHRWLFDIDEDYAAADAPS